VLFFGLKIAISGKGGVGKSTVAAIWSKIAHNRGNTVLSLDADPDANLAHALGFPKNIRSQIRPISL
jgi:CO dehydrogenase maturation factor